MCLALSKAQLLCSHEQAHHIPVFSVRLVHAGLTLMLETKDGESKTFVATQRPLGLNLQNVVLPVMTSVVDHVVCPSCFIRFYMTFE